MTLSRVSGIALLLLAVGCAAGPQAVATLTQLPEPTDARDSLPTVARVGYEAANASAPADSAPAAPELIQPPTVAKPLAPNAQLMLPQCLPSADGLTLQALEQMALANNPAIAQSAARLRALRGKWVQVGLKPNPTVGYLGSEIGNEGAAGQQGGFVGQNFITAQKLQRNRAVVSAEISRAEQDLAAATRRVLTDVRQSYYNALLAQRRVDLAVELVRVASEAAKSSQSLYQAEEIPLAGLLQTEVQQQNAQVFSRTAQNGLSQAWRGLSAVLGGRPLPMQALQGDVNKLPTSLDWEAQLARLQSESPEVAAAMAGVLRARRALNRACVEAVPNVSTQWSVQYDDATDYTVAGVQIGLPLPIWNRNQGGIQQAHAEISEAMRNVERVELRLNQRLADTFAEYSNARITAESYANEILPRSQRTFELVQAGYAQGEVGYLDLLAAQQTFSQTNLAYLDALSNLWQSYVRIDGLLLEGSLEQP
jgi:cobalt-zinc-cadmium efflux system outer membrane protein